MKIQLSRNEREGRYAGKSKTYLVVKYGLKLVGIKHVRSAFFDVSLKANNK